MFFIGTVGTPNADLRYVVVYLMATRCGRDNTVDVVTGDLGGGDCGSMAVVEAFGLRSK